MTEKDLENIIKNVLLTSDGMDFVCYLLDEFGTFSTKINVIDGKIPNIEKIIKREQGEFILELIRQYDFKKYVEIQERRSNEKWNKTLN